MKRLLFAAALVACIAAPLQMEAQTTYPKTFAGVGTGATTLSYFIAPASGQGIPRLQYINATSDKAGSVIQFYTAAAGTRITTASTGTTITAVGTSYASNDVIIVRFRATDTYQRLVVSASTATNITTTAALQATAAVGDTVYEVTAAGSIPVGAATKELNAGAGAIFNGQEGYPLLFEIDGTSACKINAASGIFQR